MRKNEKKLNDFLTGVSDFFAKHTDENGRNFCAKHKVEHVGKTVYSIGIDIHLFNSTGEDKYKDRVIKRAKRIITLIGEEKGTHFFIPTGDPKWNMSNRIIDSGAAVDMLSLVLLNADKLSVDKQLLSEISSVVETCSDTYLVINAVKKDHTNQRLWGATGLGTSYKFFKKEEYKKAIQDSCERSFNEYLEDGSIPYVTDEGGLKTHSSIVDTTTYYHSRHIAFMSYALDSVGDLDEELFSRMKPTIDFLIGMYQANGVKNIRLETKRWYFTSSYEIASHSYDVHALALAYRYTKDPKYAYYAVESLKQLYKHQVRDDGGIEDHLGETSNFQCPYFWNSHCAWLTRVYDVVEDLFEAAEEFCPHHEDWFENTQLLNFRNENYAFMVRGNKKPTDSLWGPSIGGGSLLYFGSKENKFKNELKTEECGYNQPANFYIKKFKWNPKEWFNLPFSNIRAHLYHIKIELRASNYSVAWYKTKNLMKKELSFFRYYSSHNCLNTKVNRHTNEIIFHGRLANFLGDTYDSIKTIRSYKYVDGSLQVTEKISSPTHIKKISYILPTNKVQDIKTDGKHKFNKREVVVKDLNFCEISYFLK